MKGLFSISLLTSLVLIVGCSNPADNVPAAAVNSETNAPEAAKGSPAANEKYFAFGPQGSTIDFVGSKVTGSHNGGFKNFAGELKVVNGQIAGAGNKVVIDTTSLWSDNDRLTGHLKSADFFDVAKFSTATFVTTSVDQKDTNSTITGNLTLHGVTKQISFPAKIDVSESAVNLSSVFFLNRFDFGIQYAGKADDLIRKEVVIKLSLAATPGRAKFEAIEKVAEAADRAPVRLASRGD